MTTINSSEKVNIRDIQLYSDGELRMYEKETNILVSNWDLKNHMGAALNRIGSRTIKYGTFTGETQVCNVYEVDWDSVNQSKIIWRKGDLVGFKSYSNHQSNDPTIYLLKVDMAKGVVVDMISTYRRRNKEDSFFS